VGGRAAGAQAPRRPWWRRMAELREVRHVVVRPPGGGESSGPGGKRWGTGAAGTAGGEAVTR
jgi:hypothetical protein